MQDFQQAEKHGEHLTGVVEKVSFFNPTTGFAVLRVSQEEGAEPVAVVGCVHEVNEGEHVEAWGAWEQDRTWGRQFRAGSLAVVPPASEEGIRRYLSSGMLKGIGPKLADVLVRAFGTDLFDIISDDPERLLDLPGIGKRKLASIVASWAEHKAMRDVMVFLQSHGIGAARALKIYRTYGEETVLLVQSDPYRLSRDIQGVGFRTADAIARSMGVAEHDPSRARAGITFALRELSAGGHCRVPEAMLIASAEKLLGIPEPLLGEAITSELEAGRLVTVVAEGSRFFYLEHLWKAELGTAGHIARILDGKLPWGGLDREKALQTAEARAGVELSASQRAAVEQALCNKLLVITGGPGVGKTTIIRTLLSVPQVEVLTVLLCAPTGRAAKRLSESAGREGRTIHRLLEFDPHTGDFKRCASNPLDADLVIVDEASMIDIVLMQKLLSAISSTAALVLAGDVDQLPPVGPGAVLGDMIRSERVPVVRLTEIFRQARQSMIVLNAHRINAGEPLLEHRGEELSDFYFVKCDSVEGIRKRLLQVVAERIPARFGLDPLRDIQVLTPMNKGALGAEALNALLQEGLNGSGRNRIERFGTAWAEGDRAIQMVNNYEREVFNGDIGVVAAIDPDEQLMVVEYDGRAVEYDFADLDELSPAWAITIHKSQGSEYPAVVIPLSMQHYAMLERNLVYTAVTRGRRLVMVIGDPKALAMAVSNSRSRSRLTGLVECIRSAVEA